MMVLESAAPGIESEVTDVRTSYRVREGEIGTIQTEDSVVQEWMSKNMCSTVSSKTIKPKKV